MLPKQTKIALCGTRAGGGEREREQGEAGRREGKDTLAEPAACGLNVCPWVCAGAL